jgi:hypothetical protein
MNQSKDHIKELEEIKKLMERSSRFLSLSGLSGVFAGIFALIGAAVAYYILDYGAVKYDEHFFFLQPIREIELIWTLFLLAMAVLVLALASGFYFSWRKAKKKGLKMWDRTARRMYTHLLIPLLTGGFFCMILISWDGVNLVASATLIFYGLALINAGKYTLNEIQYLGITEVILGILAGIFVNFGLLFWALGFGVLHIVYGAVMYYRYERKSD